MMNEVYTTTLNAGIGMIEETRVLLDLWQSGMSVAELYNHALTSGQFPNMSARRLKNFLVECFKPRYLIDGESPAKILKALRRKSTAAEFDQLLFIYTCRSSLILASFVREVYWRAYVAGSQHITNEDAQQFVRRANQDGKTAKPWSDQTIRRVATYLTRSCADYRLLERGTKSKRTILPFRIEPKVATILAYDLHCAGHGDNRVINDPDWSLFGMDRADVIDELKRVALTGALIVQSAADVTHVSWRYGNMEALINDFPEG